MDKSNAQKMKLGLFVIIGSAILIVAVYFIGSKQNMFGSNFEISAVFKNVNGLQSGNNVRFSGINVGTVKNIDMVNDTTIHVYMLIQEKMLGHIKKDAIAAVGSDGLVGSMIINITPGRGHAGQVNSGDEIQSYSRIASEDMLSTLNVTNENAAILTSDLLKLTQALNEGKGTLGKLIYDSLMANNLTESIENLKMISNDASIAMKEINEIMKSENFENSPAGVLLTDVDSGEKMKNMINNLDASSEEIDELIEDLKLAIESITEGDGVINYLASDTILVMRLDTTMQNIEEGSVRFNENMEALKHNFLTRGYFKDQEKEAKKAKKK